MTQLSQNTPTQAPDSRMARLWRLLAPNSRIKRWLYLGLILYLMGGIWSGFLTLVGLSIIVVCVIYYLWHTARYIRERILWKVRNRLLASFVFVGLVPMVLFTGIVLLMIWFAVGVIGANQIKKQFDITLDQMNHIPDQLQQELYRSIIQTGDVTPSVAVAKTLQALQDLPNISITLFEQDSLIYSNAVRPSEISQPEWYTGERMNSVVIDRNNISFRAIADVDIGYSQLTMIASYPLDKAYQEMIWNTVGVFFFQPGYILEHSGDSPEESRPIGADLLTEPGSPMPADGEHIALPQWLQDLRIRWGGLIRVTDWELGPDTPLPVLLAFRVRIDPARTIHESTSQDLDQAGLLIFALLILCGILLIVELMSFTIGFVISRRVTSAVHSLSTATSALQGGNLDFRIKKQTKDQLGELGESFNVMAQHIQDLLAELQAHADELEARVADRTAEIARSLEELQATQTQLVQTEKMAALGKLVAGVVHEMNTPLGAINSATDVSKRCISTIVDTLEEGASLDEIKTNPTMKRALDMLPNGNRVTLDASQRLSKILTSLRSFTRLDEATIQEMDLHEGIDDTLTLMEHEFGDHIEVVKLYGDLPLVVCFPGEINQVFMNLLTNAIQAIGETGQITIRTSVDEAHVIIQITDNGEGMSPDQLEALFEPKFSSQGKRVKASLGLFTCYNIIEKHGGSIRVESGPQQGTEVTITLPKMPKLQVEESAA